MESRGELMLRMFGMSSAAQRLREIIGGKAFPLAGTALPAHPLLRGDPATPPESESADGFAVTG